MATAAKVVEDSDTTSLLAASSSVEASVAIESSSARQVEHTYPKLPLWRKLTYGVGSILYSMTTVVTGFYLQIFLLEVAILDPVYVSVIVFAGRVWDALTDPTVGYLTSRTKTRIGRLRPWMLVSIVPCAVLFFLLWFVPHWSSGAKFAYFFIVYLLLQAALTCFHVPYTALVMHLTDCNKQRDSATLYRLCFEVSGTFLGSLIQGMSLVVFQAPSLDSCTGSGGSQRTYSVPLERGYRYGALLVAAIAAVCGFITFLGVKEQKEQQNVNKGLSPLKSLKVTLGYRPYTYLVIMYMLSWLAVQVVQANLALYVKYTLGLGSHFQYIIIVVLVFSILSLPLWQLIIVKFGKKPAYSVGAWVFIFALFIMLFMDDAPYTVYIIYPQAALGGVGIGAMYLLPWSMLPDVVDKAYLEQGVRREELFYSFYVFFSKFGAGVSLGISTLVLKAGGFNEQQCLQLWSVPLTLKVLLTAGPILLVMLSLVFHRLYPIDEAARRDIRNRITQSRSVPVRVHYGNHDDDFTDSMVAKSITKQSQCSESQFQFTPSGSTEKINAAK